MTKVRRPYVSRLGSSGLIGVAIARGAAAVVARPPPQEYGAAGTGHEEYNGQEHEGASPEYSPDAR